MGGNLTDIDEINEQKYNLIFVYFHGILVHVNKIREKFFGAGCNSLPAVIVRDPLRFKRLPA